MGDKVDKNNSPIDIKIRCYKFSVDVIKFISSIDVGRRF